MKTSVFFFFVFFFFVFFCLFFFFLFTSAIHEWNFWMFLLHEMKYLWYLLQKSKFSFYFIVSMIICFWLHTWLDQTKRISYDIDVQYQTHVALDRQNQIL